MDKNDPSLDKTTPLETGKFLHRKKMSGVRMDVLDDEEYSVDEIIDSLKKKSFPSFKMTSEESDTVDFPGKEPQSYRSLDVNTSTVDSSLSSREQVNLIELRDLLDRRISDARFDVVENKIDRIITSLKDDSNGEEKQLLKIMLARIRDLEQKLDQKTIRKSSVPFSPDPVYEKPVHPYSTYVVEKATQTPSENHKCEGVYVLVSKKNNQKVRKVHRHLGYCLDDKVNLKGTYYYHDYNKQYKPLFRRVVRRVGYPEYVYEETHHHNEPMWNKTVRKSVEFLPPIPDPYAKRRPKNCNN